MEYVSHQDNRENNNARSVKGISLGRLFEVGFNAGIISAIDQLHIEHAHQGFYVKELRQFKCGAVLTRLCDDHSITDQVDRDLLKQWMVDFLRRGWFAGPGLLKSLDTTREGPPQDEKRIDGVAAPP